MTITADGISDSVTRGFRSSLRVSRYGDGHLLVLPQSYASGTLLSVLITEDAGTIVVSDRGLTAEQLEDAGVDIDRTAVRKSWEHIQASTGILPAMGAPDWELTVMGNQADLSVLVQAVADAAMRADGLRALSKKQRRLSFAQRVIKAVFDHNLPAIPRAELVGKYGSRRQVTCKVEIANGLYVQGLSGRDSDARISAFDHTTAVFTHALVDPAHLVSVLEGDRWDPWQVESLKDLSRVEYDTTFDRMLEDLALA